MKKTFRVSVSLVLVVAIFGATFAAAPASAIISKKALVNTVSVKNTQTKMSIKPPHANITINPQIKNFAPTTKPALPVTELPTITVESLIDIAVERPDPYGSSPMNAEVVFKRSSINAQVDSLPLDVPFTVSGKAIEGVDYTLGILRQHVVHFPANVFEVRLSIMPIVTNVDQGSRSVIFNLNADTSTFIPTYKLGDKSRAITFVSEYSNHPAVDLTVNGDRGRTTIHAGQSASINLEVRQATGCIIWGSGFDGSPSLPTKSVLAGFWSAVVYPTESTEYQILCQNGGYRQPQIFQVVSVTVLD